jgi:hypothetical protein
MAGKPGRAPALYAVLARISLTSSSTGLLARYMLLMYTNWSGMKPGRLYCWNACCGHSRLGTGALAGAKDTPRPRLLK